MDAATVVTTAVIQLLQKHKTTPATHTTNIILKKPLSANIWRPFLK